MAAIARIARRTTCARCDPMRSHWWLAALGLCMLQAAQASEPVVPPLAAARATQAMRVTSGRGKALPFPGLARGFPGGVIEWYYNPNGAPAAMASAAQGIIAAAAQEWAQVCAVHFTYRGESALRMAWDGHNVVSWNPDAYGAAGQTAAYYGTSAVLEDADIVLSPFLDAQGLHAIVAHEWGHALGLTHSDQPGALMSGPPLTSYSGLDAPTDPAEQRALGATGSQWRETGMHWGAWIRATSAAVPVCRFYGDWRTDAATGLRRGPDTHFHTGSDAECSALVQRFPEWIMESAAAFFLELPVNDACAAGRTVLLRWFRPWGEPVHRHTGTKAAASAMANAGWLAEGPALCAPAPP